MFVTPFGFACTPTADPVGRGGECFLAIDCAPGLVCLEQSNKTRMCSDDLGVQLLFIPEEHGGMGVTL